MRLIAKLVVVMFGLAFALPAVAQSFDRPASCEAALANLEAVRTGKQFPPSGSRPDLWRLRAKGGYSMPAAAPYFAVDAFREHGDVRALCPPAKWPAGVKPEGLKTALAVGVKADQDMFCGKGAGNYDAPYLILRLTGDAGVKGFADRILELQGALTPGETVQTAARHASDYAWLHEVAGDIADACGNGKDLNSAIAQTSANAAVNFAKDNVDFVACVKSREPILKAAMTEFDDAAKANDQAKMEAAYPKLEAAYATAKPGCAASKEGAMENDYVLASKKMRILFITTPGCRDAAVTINNLRQSTNGTKSRRSIDDYARLIREAGKTAAATCKDPSPQTWAEFVAWIAVANKYRLPDMN